MIKNGWILFPEGYRVCFPQDKMLVIIVCDFFFPILPTFRDRPWHFEPRQPNFLPDSLQESTTIEILRIKHLLSNTKCLDIETDFKLNNFVPVHNSNLFLEISRWISILFYLKSKRKKRIKELDVFSSNRTKAKLIRRQLREEEKEWIRT